MKKILIYSYLLLLGLVWSACERESGYPGTQVSPYMAIYDIRNLYKGQDVVLNKENMFGSNKIAGMVISDHSGGNMPEGLLILQDRRRLSQLRGIAIALGNEAKNYSSGDSILVTVEGATLTRANGILQLKNVGAVTKVSAGNWIAPNNRIPISEILTNPDKYESTLVAIVKGGFDPLPSPTDVYAGDKLLNDGFGDIILHTEATATFANQKPPALGNFYGLVIPDATGKPQLRLRKQSDVIALSSAVEAAPIVIAGFMSDPADGTAGNNEYMQFLATQDIDFALTPYAVVTNCNGTSTTPLGYPANGWATGGGRSYKFNLTSGTVSKGEIFYVGNSAKVINGAGSTVISTAKWIKAINYSTTAGESATPGDGIGSKISNLLIGSTTAVGIAVFKGTQIDVNSIPVDVIFSGSQGTIYTDGTPAQGYRITNTDYFDYIDPLTLKEQPFFRSGTNLLCFEHLSSPTGKFNVLGGVYNPSLGRWTKARVKVQVALTATSQLAAIEPDDKTKLTP